MLGILSIIFWALVIIVTLKYVWLIMRADNRGEGGILALTALVSRGLGNRGRRRWWLVGFGIFGAAMFYGDGMITPAISVLGAVEGLEIIAPDLHPFIVPVTVLIVLVLFAIQKRGTASVGRLFGPVMCVWFVALAVLGLLQVIAHPGGARRDRSEECLRLRLRQPAASRSSRWAPSSSRSPAPRRSTPTWGISARRRSAAPGCWFVVPALVLNYFGQGALLLADPAAIKNPFYLLAPQWALIPLVVLATCAAVIASQAVISGAFSLTRAAIQMGYCPRLKIQHTSDRQIGQIYVPFINWTLLIAVVLLVVGFRSSDNLGGAYGIAVTLAMLIDSVLIFVVMRRIWGWNRLVAALVVLPLFLIDLSFLASNSLKVPAGGWFPLLIGAIVFTLLTTWKRGRALLMERLAEDSMPLGLFIESIEASPPTRVQGTATFLTSTADRVPHALLHNLKHNKVLHDRVVFLTIHTQDFPRVPPRERVRITELGCAFWRMDAYYGFAEDPDVPELLEAVGKEGFEFDMMETSFFVSRETLIASVAPGMALWRERLFVSMSKMAVKATDFFHIPTNRVVELGTQVEL